ncbi:MAG: hypothetical protein FWH40_04785 [Coriobacteriia bacterium]|nr:hypothetical protein [Coriobacteriia bacterium]
MRSPRTTRPNKARMQTKAVLPFCRGTSSPQRDAAHLPDASTASQASMTAACQA